MEKLVQFIYNVLSYRTEGMIMEGLVDYPIWSELVVNKIILNKRFRSVDGSLSATAADGDIDIHLANHSKVDLSASRGAANITVAESLSSEVKIQTEHLDVDGCLVFNVNSKEIKSATMQVQGNVLL